MRRCSAGVYCLCYQSRILCMGRNKMIEKLKEVDGCSKDFSLTSPSPTPHPCSSCFAFSIESQSIFGLQPIPTCNHGIYWPARLFAKPLPTLSRPPWCPKESPTLSLHPCFRNCNRCSETKEEDDIISLHCTHPYLATPLILDVPHYPDWCPKIPFYYIHPPVHGPVHNHSSLLPCPYCGGKIKADRPIISRTKGR